MKSALTPRTGALRALTAFGANQFFFGGGVATEIGSCSEGLRREQGRLRWVS
jgi:hypothetical protein